MFGLLMCRTAYCRMHILRLSIGCKASALTGVNYTLGIFAAATALSLASASVQDMNFFVFAVARIVERMACHTFGGITYMGTALLIVLMAHSVQLFRLVQSVSLTADMLGLAQTP